MPIVISESLAPLPIAALVEKLLAPSGFSREFEINFNRRVPSVAASLKTLTYPERI